MGYHPGHQRQGRVVRLQTRDHRYATGEPHPRLGSHGAWSWADGQNKADPEKGLSVGGSVINVASFVAKMGAATPQLACESTILPRRHIPTTSPISSISLSVEGAVSLRFAPAADRLDTASKGAVLAMTRELAMVHAREGIRFNALCPGPIRTPLLMDYLDTPEKLNRRLVHNPIGRFGEAVEQAKAVVFCGSFPPPPSQPHLQLFCPWRCSSRVADDEWPRTTRPMSMAQTLWSTAVCMRVTS